LRVLLDASVYSRRTAVNELRATLPPQIDNHKILRIIGSGSYGDVLLARNLVTGTYRAIKVVWRPAFKDERPYQRELEAIRFFEPISRSHQGFVQILQVGELENGFYYLMELADDERTGQLVDPETYVPHSLARRTAQPSSPDECIAIGLHLARALAVLHEKQLIHRDIKPSNIIFVEGRPKLADIGLVTSMADAHSFVGTAGFVPPEGPVSAASDIYSLGKVLYELATGKEVPRHFQWADGSVTGKIGLWI
jgi:eukaryotic-like serine/threonine-protein kinase